MLYEVITDVKELRERTGAGMMDCKKAMVETDGDIEKAIEFLREKGLAAAAKKAGRIAAEGAVGSYLSEDKKTGAVVEINCETDFVALTDEFQSFVKEVAEHIVKENPADLDALLAQSFAADTSKTVSDAVTEKVAKIGEKISIRRFTRYEAANGVLGVITSYSIHYTKLYETQNRGFYLETSPHLLILMNFRMNR